MEQSINNKKKVCLRKPWFYWSY